MIYYDETWNGVIFSDKTCWFASCKLRLMFCLLFSQEAIESHRAGSLSALRDTGWWVLLSVSSVSWLETIDLYFQLIQISILRSSDKKLCRRVIFHLIYTLQRKAFTLLEELESFQKIRNVSLNFELSFLFRYKLYTHSVSEWVSNTILVPFHIHNFNNLL